MLRKFIKEICIEAWEDIHSSKTGTLKAEIENNHKFVDISEEEKVSIKKLILGLSNKNCNVQNYSDKVLISGNDSNRYYFNIQAIKGVGVIMEMENKSGVWNCKLKYQELYDEISDEIKNILNEKSLDDFHNLSNHLLKDFKLLRESNLDNILS